MAEHLPAGGYVARIEAAELKQSRALTLYLELTLDIVEGPMTGWYHKDYERYANSRYGARYRGKYNLFYPLNNGTERDSWTVSNYHAQTKALEESNQGYKWNPKDPRPLVGKLIGIVVREAEWNGFIFTKIGALTSVKSIQNGTFKPLGRLADKSASALPQNSGSVNQVPQGFTTVDTPNDLPF